MGSLPFLLAGPILRRTTPNRVCVWLATSEPKKLIVEIFSKDGRCVGESAILPHTTHKLGQKLYVHLLQAKPTDKRGFPTDQLLYYKIYEDETKLHSLDLSDCCLKGSNLPSFFIPSFIKHLAQGSCRKPQGKAKAEQGNALQYDALASLRQYLDRVGDDLSKRPSTLCLTGDQIYADDVAACLIRPLNRLATELMGSRYGVPEIANLEEIPPGDRKEILKQKNSGITSSESFNHLISFGEFAAMYLLALGNLVKVELEPEQNTDKDETTKLVMVFLDGLKDVRCVLANITVYTQFDDHEVTDDWNIDGAWFNDVKNSAVGRRIVSNGLAAYWAFQGWGNAPDEFDNEFCRALVEHLADLEEPMKGERYDTQTWTHRRWSYSVPTSPPIIVLDTRTQRQFDKPKKPPRLMNRSALDWLKAEWCRLQARHVTGMPIMVSPVPVFGFEPTDLLTKTAAFFGFNRKADSEGWILNKAGYSHFLDTLAIDLRLKNVIFLSGDLHVSFVNKGYYISGGAKLSGYQLTCSSLKNSPGHEKVIDRLARMFGKTERCCGWRENNKTWCSVVEQVSYQGCSNNSITTLPSFAILELNNGIPIQQVLHCGKEQQRIYKLKDE